MTRITLVRHGETDWNKQNIIQGRSDIPLNETGIKQAHLTSQNFMNESFDMIYATPLIRTKQTALIIAKNISYKKDIFIAEDFIERDFGEADGKKIEDYYNLVHEDQIKNLETEETIMNRVLTGLRVLGSKHNGMNILVVCHSHTIKAALAAIEKENYDFKYKLSNCSITTLDYNNQTDTFKIEKVNYNEHL